MRTALKLAAAAALLLALPALAAPGIGDKAPDFKLKTLNGDKEISLADLRGKVVYLDFWASWCGPCRRSFPEVKKLHQEYKDKGMEVLAISLDRSPEPAIKFMAEQMAGFESLFDMNGGVANGLFGVRSIPTTVIIGPDGTIAYSMIGFNPAKVGEIKSTIEGLLAKVELPVETTSQDKL